MNLQQLRYLCAIVDHGLNVSDAAAALFTSQPGVSKQVRQLEDELGVRVFVRIGKRIASVTPAGEAVIATARRALREVENVKRVGAEFKNENEGTLAIATTHTQARYVLPRVVRDFAARFPRVKLELHQGNPVQVAEHTARGDADIGIATEALASFPDLVTLPCYQWNRCVLVPRGHPLAKVKVLTLAALARHPIITYDFAFTGRSQINAAFDAEGLAPNVVLTALDSDVIKTYVELGMGVGIVAQMAHDPDRDRAFVKLDAGHLFAPSTTRLAVAPRRVPARLRLRVHTPLRPGARSGDGRCGAGRHTIPRPPDPRPTTGKTRLHDPLPQLACPRADRRRDRARCRGGRRAADGSAFDQRPQDHRRGRGDARAAIDGTHASLQPQARPRHDLRVRAPGTASRSG